MAFEEEESREVATRCDSERVVHTHLWSHKFRLLSQAAHQCGHMGSPFEPALKT